MSRSREWPIAVRTVDISRPLEALDGVDQHALVRLFVLDAGEMIGSVDIWHAHAPSIPAARVGHAITESLGHVLFRRDIARQLETVAPRAVALPDDTRVSIVVPTCDRPEDLRRCLASLVAQRTARPLEIVVVDNRPLDSSTRQIVREFTGVRLVSESRAGLSYARNAGIAAATGDIIVATDDDVVAPPDWVERLIAPFARPEVMAVNGNVLPLELETESQCRFEAYGGLGKGYTAFEVNHAWFASRRTAVPTWHLGATANSAFRAAIFRDPAIGLLDEALGAGTPTGCSEDTYLYYKILKAGHVIVYEPTAYVWHRHRTTMESLRKQIHAYSKGHVAYHLTTWLQDHDRRALTRLLYSLPKTYMRRAWQRLRGASDYPLSLILLEIRGNLGGAAALWRSRRRVRELGPSTPLIAHAAAPEEPSHALPLESPVAEGPAPQPDVAPLARASR